MVEGENKYEYINGERITPVGNIPEGRQGHVMVTYEYKLWIMGGRGNGKGRVLLRDLWSFCPPKTWEEIKRTGESPPNIHNHSGVVYKYKMIIFGGATDSTKAPGGWINNYLNTTYEYSFKDKVWNELETINPPPARNGHSAHLIGDKMYIFGGSATDSIYFQDIYCLHLGLDVDLDLDLDLDVDLDPLPTWHKIEIVGDPPPPRNWHSALNTQDNIYIFGGYCYKGSEIYYNDTWSYDLLHSQWTLLNPGGDQLLGENENEVVGLELPPMPRNRAAAVLLSKDYFLIHGGNYYPPDTFLSDVHLFSILHREWKPLNYDYSALPVVGHHTIGMLGDHIYLFGGERNELRLNEIWEIYIN